MWSLRAHFQRRRPARMTRIQRCGGYLQFTTAGDSRSIRRDHRMMPGFFSGCGKASYEWRVRGGSALGEMELCQHLRY